MPESTTVKQSHGFQPGVSGNPAGRPRGARNKVTVAAETLLAGQAGALTQKLIEVALGGDVAALKLCFERLCPVPRSAKLDIDLPEDVLAYPASAVQAIQRAMLGGEIDPDLAAKVLDVLTTRIGILPGADALAMTIDVPPVAPSAEVWTEWAKQHMAAN